jgi:uncharacterized membrane protein YqjE
VADTFAALSELMAAAGRMAGLALDLVVDRLELLGLEAREAKIRLVQLLLLALFGAALFLLGLGLAILALFLVLPPQGRLVLAAGGGGLLLVLGTVALLMLRRRLARLPLAFSQSVAEIKKDRACF